jgi:hypothetical protein
LRHEFVDSVFVKILLLLFFQEKKRGFGRSREILISVFGKLGAPPDKRAAITLI